MLQSGNDISSIFDLVWTFRFRQSCANYFRVSSHLILQTAQRRGWLQGWHLVHTQHNRRQQRRTCNAEEGPRGRSSSARRACVFLLRKQQHMCCAEEGPRGGTSSTPRGTKQMHQHQRSAEEGHRGGTSSALSGKKQQQQHQRSAEEGPRGGTSRTVIVISRGNSISASRMMAPGVASEAHARTHARSKLYQRLRRCAVSVEGPRGGTVCVSLCVQQ